MTKLIVTITGPTTSGKTTLVRKLLAPVNEYNSLEPARFIEIVSHTTRLPREGERHEIDYHFVSDSKFKKTKLIESVEFNDHLYGLSEKEVKDKLNTDKIPLVILEPNGVSQLEQYLISKDLDAVIFSIFVNVSTEEALRRLGDRKFPTEYDRVLRTHHYLTKEILMEHMYKWNVVIQSYDTRNSSRINRQLRHIIDAVQLGVENGYDDQTLSAKL